MRQIKLYYQLTKPGIVGGNLITAAAGFFLASRGQLDWALLLATLAGIALIIAGACVCNNVIDRPLDRKMARTINRALAANKISARSALTYAAALGLSGFGLLAAWTNTLTVLLGIIAMSVYVILYGLAKRRSVHGTLVGSIAGALPPVAGYTAVANNFDGGAGLLFLVLVCWQMAHFYSIAMFRFDDYKAAGLPVLPVKKGMAATKIQVLLYVIAFIIAASLLTVFGYTGYIYLLVILLTGLAWLRLTLKAFSAPDDRRWARSMFFFSLAVIMLFSVTLSLDAWSKKFESSNVRSESSQN